MVHVRDNAWQRFHYEELINDEEAKTIRCEAGETFSLSLS